MIYESLVQKFQNIIDKHAQNMLKQKNCTMQPGTFHE